MLTFLIPCINVLYYHYRRDTVALAIRLNVRIYVPGMYLRVYAHRSVIRFVLSRTNTTQKNTCVHIRH